MIKLVGFPGVEARVHEDITRQHEKPWNPGVTPREQVQRSKSRLLIQMPRHGHAWAMNLAGPNEVMRSPVAVDNGLVYVLLNTVALLC